MLKFVILKTIVIMTSSNGNISALPAFREGNPPVNGGFPSQGPMTRSFDVLFEERLNKRLRKHSRWFEKPSRSLWRHCNYIIKSRWIIITSALYIRNVSNQSCKIGELNLVNINQSRKIATLNFVNIVLPMSRHLVVKKSQINIMLTLRLKLFLIRFIKVCLAR